MNCEQVRDLAPAFALDALGPSERDAVVAHLRECDQHPELVEFRAAAFAAAMAAPERRPREALRERILAATEVQKPTTVTRANGRNRTGDRFRAWPAALAAGLVLLVAVAAGALLLNRDDGDDLHVREFTTEAGIVVRVEAALGQPRTEVTFSGLEQPPPGEEYVLWAIRAGDWVTIGTFEPGSGGAWSGTFAFAFLEGDAICLTMSGTESATEPFGSPLFMEPV